MFVFFHRMKLKLNWFSVGKRIMLVQMFLMIIRKSHSETNWSYDPGPPILYLAVCEGKEMVVTVNDAHLDQPPHKSSRLLKNFLLLGLAKEFLCLAKNIVLEGCLGMFPN